MRIWSYLTRIYIVLICSTSFGFDRSFFYRASSFWGEPRFEKKLLTSFELQLSGGSTSCGLNCKGGKTNILSIYGPENPHTLSTLCTMAASSKHNALKNSLGRSTFTNQTLSFQGLFAICEINFNYYQNFCSGLFWHFHLPFALIQLHSLRYRAPQLDNVQENISHTHSKGTTDLSKILKNTLHIRSLRSVGLSDPTLFFGLTTNYENTVYLDYIDAALQVGILFPTGREKNEHLLFDIPYGYNGHWGIASVADISCGIYDWLTWGFHGDAVFFINKTSCIGLKLPGDTTGFIKLAQAPATVSSGPVWRLGSYIKADHFCAGLSALIAVTYEQKQRTHVYPVNQTLVSSECNKDEQLKAWSRSLMHFMLDYDFSCEERKVGLHTSIFYNLTLAGKRIFKTNTVGGILGLDVCWCF